MATHYYTYRREADAALQAGQEVRFAAGKGYYLVSVQQGTTALTTLPSDAGDRTPQAPVVIDTIGTPPAGQPGTVRANQPAAPVNETAPTIDWEAVLGQYGIPPDVVSELTQLWAINFKNPNAFDIARAYVRSTQWYTETYPGIQQGLNAGLFTSEQGYKTYQNQINVLYQQYYGRPATASETATYIKSGLPASYVANEFQAQAILGNINDPLRALFTPAELQAFANQQAGIDTELGQKIVAQANLAMQIGPLYTDFYGRAPTRAEIDQLTQSGTDAQTVARQFTTQENINAMNPAVSALFTPQEIHDIALDQAGGITPTGKRLADLAQLATQLNPLYHQYTNDGVSRAEVEQAYSAGTPVNDIAKQFAGKAFIEANKGEIQQTTGAFGDAGQLTPEQLTALGSEQAGYDTPLGQVALAAYGKAQQRLQGVFKGFLASPSLTIQGGKLRGPQRQPDVPS